MELETGDDLIALKEAVENRAVLTTDPESVEEADEYARNNGLTIDSLENSWWARKPEDDPAIAATLDHSKPGTLFEVEGLQECSFRPIIPLPEKWSMTIPSLRLFQKVYMPPREDELVDHMTQLSRPLACLNKRLKYEEPILRSGYDEDCRELANRLSVFRKGPLPDHRLPVHPNCPERDEGLEFTTRAKMGDESLMTAARKERLAASKETLAFARRCLQADWTHEDQNKLLESISTYTGLADQRYMTPPLSPLLESHTKVAEFFVPDPEACQVPEPSTITFNISDEIETAEQRIFQDDNTFWASVASQQLASPERYKAIDISGMVRVGVLSSPKKSHVSSPQAEYLKLEVPLLPNDMILDPSDTPIRVLSPQDLAHARELITTSDDSSTMDQQFSHFLQAMSDKVMRSAEQEKLDPLDGTARIHIPVMDFSAPPCEWEEEGCDTPEIMFAWIKEHNKDTDWKPIKWPSNKTAEQRMVWSPIPHIKSTKTLVTESIEIDHDILDSFLKMNLEGEVMTSADCIEKTPGLAILRQDNDDDDEMLEEELTIAPENLPGAPSPTEFVPRRLRAKAAAERVLSPLTQPGHPLRGTKRLLENPEEERTWSTQEMTSKERAPLSQSLDSHTATGPVVDSLSALEAIMDAPLWADPSVMVERYAKMNSSKKLKHTHSRFFGPGPTPPKEPTPVLTKKQQEQTALMPPPPKPIPALAPSFTPQPIPPKIIASISVSQLLIIHLQTLLPGIDIINRDYDKRKPPGGNPGLCSSNLDDADITISPATGILLTTMVKLRQKSLPGKIGHSNNASYRHVVENVAMRYERLIVYVSEGNKHSECITQLLQSDAKALAEFQGFAAGLSSNVTVVYIGGGTETLAKWVASTICQYAAEGRLVQDPLLSEETCWELFLRRAGMNAYGAQAVLGTLKSLEDKPATGSGEMYGLPLFMMMTAEERLVMYEDVFGGRKVLTRVSEAIEEPWGQRAVEEARYLQGAPDAYMGGSSYINGRRA